MSHYNSNNQGGFRTFFFFLILDFRIWVAVVTVVRAAAVPKGAVGLPKGEHVA